MQKLCSFSRVLSITACKNHLCLTEGQTNNLVQHLNYNHLPANDLKTTVAAECYKMSTCRIYNGLYMKSEVSTSMTAMQSLCAACLRMQSQSSCFTKASSAHRGAKMPLNIFIDDIIVAPVLYINHLFIFRLLLYYWCSWCCAVACELYDDRHLYQ